MRLDVYDRDRPDSEPIDSIELDGMPLRTESHTFYVSREATVYAVWRGAYEDAYIDAVFTTRELAEQYIGTDLRREWEKLYRKGGRVIPRAGYKDGKGGVIPQHEPYPTSFDEWCKGQDRGYIEELDVLDSLPE